MMHKNIFVSWLVVLIIFVFSVTSLSAAPRNVNSYKNLRTSLKLNAAQLKAQQALTEAAYIRLLKISENKAKDKKLLKAKSRNKTAAIKYNKRLDVIATAYTSHVNQTDSTPNIAAWGDRLKPGMKVIAVSRDLLNVYGLKHKQKVRIKGLKGEYLVLDKMNKRWRKKIDIYMGMDKKKAFRWGKRKVEILWNS